MKKIFALFKAFTITSATAYSVQVGKGGTYDGTIQTTGQNETVITFFSINASGGVGGVGRSGGLNGGSGGGATTLFPSIGIGNLERSQSPRTLAT